MARWDNPGIPHKGWTLVDYIDIREDAVEFFCTVKNTFYLILRGCNNITVRVCHFSVLFLKTSV